MTPHAGDDDLLGVLAPFVAAGVDVPLRPDHGRMAWGGRAIPGHGLDDRAIGLGYPQGLVAALERTRS